MQNIAENNILQRNVHHMKEHITITSVANDEKSLNYEFQI